MGKFIVIEGSDGAGKATQVKLLEEYFDTQNISHETISIPRYDNNLYGSLISRYLQGEFGDPTRIDPYLSSLAYAGDRALAKPILEGWLKTTDLIIADRYAYSNMAFGAAKLPEEKRAEFIAWDEELEFEENGIPKENLVIYLYVPFEISQQLMADRKKDGHESNLDFLREVEKEYLKLAERENWVKIDCTINNALKSREEIHQEIIKTLKEKGLLN